MKILLPALLLPALLASAPAPCDAARCSCVPAPPAGEALRAADAVFEGRVADVRTVRAPDGSEERHARFEVGGAWKGALADTVTVATGAGGGDCGFPFRAGERYLVFARSDGGLLFTGICSRTRSAAEAAADRAALGAPRAR